MHNIYSYIFQYLYRHKFSKIPLKQMLFKCWEQINYEYVCWFRPDEYSRSATKNIVTDIKRNIIKRKELFKRHDTQWFRFHVMYKITWYAFNMMMRMCGQFFRTYTTFLSKWTVHKLDLNINTQKLNHGDSSL